MAIEHYGHRSSHKYTEGWSFILGSEPGYPFPTSIHRIASTRSKLPLDTYEGWGEIHE
jgi:hypothetical protein